MPCPWRSGVERHALCPLRIVCIVLRQPCPWRTAGSACARPCPWRTAGSACSRPCPSGSSCIARCLACLHVPQVNIACRWRCSFASFIMPLLAGEALVRRALLPIRPREGANDAAAGANHARAEGRHRDSITKSVDIEHRFVVAELIHDPQRFARLVPAFWQGSPRGPLIVLARQRAPRERGQVERGIRPEREVGGRITLRARDGCANATPDYQIQARDILRLVGPTLDQTQLSSRSADGAAGLSHPRLTTFYIPGPGQLMT